MFSGWFEKTALIGPALDIGNLGIPSIVGYHLGKQEARGSKHKEEKNGPSAIGSAAKFLLIPGYTGYRMGVRAGYKEKNEKA